MANKYLIIDNSLRISASIEFHRELLPKKEPTRSGFGGFKPDKRDIVDPEVKGGGWWHFNAEEKYLLLYGSSEEFGPATRKDIESAINKTHFPLRWENFDVYHSTAMFLTDALNVMSENKLICKVEKYG